MCSNRQLCELESINQEMEIIKKYIDNVSTSEASLQVLEAGCGQRWELDLDNIFLTGVDLDPAALEIRKNIQKDLHKAIQGDLLTIELPAARFDVIYNSYVLEHIEDAGAVMENFYRWLKPGGIIVLRIPDPDSVRGFVTRMTPHWFHILYYRYLLGDRNAGQQGHSPYPTYYHPVVSRRGIHEFCARHSLLVKEEYTDGGYYRLDEGMIPFLSRVIVRTAATLSFGKLSARHSNLLFILEKQ